MIIEVIIPTPGESITEVELANWMVKDGDYVEKNQEIAEIESDKATLPLIAEKAGKLKILVDEGSTVNVGTVACQIDTDGKAPETNVKEPVTGEKKSYIGETEKNAPRPSKEVVEEDAIQSEPPESKEVKVTPLAKKLMEEEDLNVDDIIDGLRKITTRDVKRVIDTGKSFSSPHPAKASREVQSNKMSQLRKKLSQRLVVVKNETAMLTTFNEVDMSAIIELRKKYQKQFTEKHGVKLGFMSFFTKAATIALQNFPKVNSMLNGDSIVTPEYVDIAIAVQTDKGLMVPVLRNTESMSLAGIEQKIVELANKARTFRLSIEEMTGGTFTITNGGIFGSMLSTPIINPPQSGILGMHNIVERPVAVNGKVEIRPVMYLALSYDHRIIDGRDSVSFLVKVKELLESPYKILLGGIDPEKSLLEI